MGSIRPIMIACIKTAEPLPEISILMAVYEPRMDWLRIQLNSLNAQTYPKLRLYIRDDCSPKVPFGNIEQMAEACITAFPFTIVRNDQNLGSNGTFERLTQEAEGDLFAYCDQDDEWLPEKLTVLQSELARTGSLLACSDMFVMDGDGHITADSITKVRRHHVFHSGTGLAGGLIFRNFVTGCTMLVDARIAKESVPFCPYLVHDQYLALRCAEQGSILSVDRSLIRYRIHGGNQTGALSGITDKKSYERIRIDDSMTRLKWLGEHLPMGRIEQQDLKIGLAWVDARQRHWHHQGGLTTLWKYRRFGPLTVLFETVAPWLPEGLFQWVIRMRKKTAK